MFGSVLSLFLGISVCAGWSEYEPTNGQLPPLTHKPEVERLPPVGNELTPTEWVSKPQFHDFFLDQGRSTVGCGKTHQKDESNLLSEFEEEQPIKLWEGSFSLGLDGAEGNNEAMNLHVGFNAQRKTELHLLLFGP